ncbi:MAG: hypothetical protein C4563_04800 [Desulfobulbus sp.]|nr:MAG: hypothetical protein C4563_04800 [Desulfobulbus sp.]
MNKNSIIFILFVAVLLGSTWGAVVNRQKIDLARRLSDAQAELARRGQPLNMKNDSTAQQEQVRKAQLALMELLKEKKALEARFADCEAAMRRQVGPKRTAQAIPAGLQEGGDGKVAAGAQLGEGAQESVQQEGLAEESLRQRLEEVEAQLVGLEKIVEEKDAALRFAIQEKKMITINMNVLLARIADQQEELDALREERRELVRQLAAGKELLQPAPQGNQSATP